MNQSGIYQILNTINGKAYIGSSNNVKHRWNQHLSELTRNIHHCPFLQRGWNKYGKDAFKFEIIEEVTVDNLLTVEQEYLNICKEFKDRFYNTYYIAYYPPNHKGLKRSAETKEKMSKAMKKPHFNARGSKHHNFDDTIYNFKNRITGEVFNGTKCDFRKLTGIESSNLSKLIKKHPRYSHCKNWSLN